MSFSVDRLLKLLKLNWRLNSQSYLLEMLTLLVLVLISVLLGFQKIYYIITFLLLAYNSSQTFNRNKQAQGAVLFSLPAQPSEKFFAAWLEVLLLKPLLYIAIYYLIYYTCYVLGSFTSLELSKPINAFAIFNKFNFVMMMILGTGSILFKKMAKLKTALLISVLSLFSIFLMYLFSVIHPEISERWSKTFIVKTIHSLQLRLEQIDENEVNEQETSDMIKEFEEAFSNINLNEIHEFNLESESLQSFYSKLKYLLFIMLLSHLMLLSWFCFRENELKV